MNDAHRFRNFKSLHMLSASIAAATLAAIFGWTATAEPTSPSTRPSPGGAFTLPPVIVTADKRPEDVQDVPGSVTAITAETIRDANITTVEQAGRFAPNVLFSQFTVPRLSFPFIRGIGSGRNSPAVTTYIDGVPQLSFATSNIELVDIDRIEFLRGPQGTLYGRNTLGGVINIWSAPPTNTFTADVQGTFGSYNLQDYRGSVSGPIVKDKLYYSFAGGYVNRDGYSRNLFTGSDVDGRNDLFGRLSLVYTPTDKLTLNVTINGEQDRDGDYALFDLAALRKNPRRINHDFEGNTRRDVSQAAFTATYKGDAVDITSISAYQQWSDRDRTDLDESPTNLIRRQSNDSEHNLVQELRFSSPDKKPIALSQDLKLNWLAGIFAFRESAKHTAGDTFSNTAVAAGIVPFAFTSFEGADNLSYGVGAFGNATLTYREKLDLTFGARYDYEHASGAVDTFASSPFVPATAARDERSFDHVSPRFAAAYHWDKDWMSYASATNGYKAGGFNITAPTGKEGFGQERSWTYEIGNKVELLDHRLTLNADVFYIDWRNQQLDVPTGQPGVFFVDNVGRSNSKGAELEASIHPLQGWDIYTGVGFTRAEFRSYIQPNGQSARGNALPYAPDFTWNAGTQYSFKIQRNLRAFVRADVIGVGNYSYDASNAAGQSSYIVTNFRAGFGGEHWRVEAFLDNAFNTHYFPLAFPFPLAASGYVAESGRPQTAGVTIGFSY